MAYAQPTDLALVGMPPTSFGPLSIPTVMAALQDASDQVDTYFRGRYGDGPSPLLLTWDSQVTRAVCKIAAYSLIDIRGRDPDRPNQFAQAYADAIQWCRDVQRQQAHPLVTVSAAPLAGSMQPNLVSSSVVNLATGRRAPNRRW